MSPFRANPVPLLMLAILFAMLTAVFVGGDRLPVIWAVPLLLASALLLAAGGYQSAKSR